MALRNHEAAAAAAAPATPPCCCRVRACLFGAGVPPKSGPPYVSVGVCHTAPEQATASEEAGVLGHRSALRRASCAAATKGGQLWCGLHRDISPAASAGARGASAAVAYPPSAVATAAAAAPAAAAIAEAAAHPSPTTPPKTGPADATDAASVLGRTVGSGTAPPPTRQETWMALCRRAPPCETRAARGRSAKSR